MNSLLSLQLLTWLLSSILLFAIAGAGQGDWQSDPVAAPPTVAQLVSSRGAAIRQDLLALEQCGTVLYVAAHPDDENTQFITYFSRGRHARTGYLSLTRGDGGQNVIGPEFGDELGVIRTQELLEARKVDGGRQFFTRAIDFGFSKDPQETMRIWDRPAVVSDIVRVIREFRPDVIVTRFSPEPSRTHGHHTASAILAVEAFKLAGDPNAFPEQLKDLQPWQARRIVQNGRFGGGDEPKPGVISFDISGIDEASGETFDAIAAKSRAKHISQGFANYVGGRNAGPRMESFQPLGGEPPTQDIFDGIDTTWARFPGGANVAKAIGEVVAKFDPANAAASIPALLKIRTTIALLPADPVIREKKDLLDPIIAACAGLEVRTRIAHPEVNPGEPMQLELRAIARGPVPVVWTGVRFPTIDNDANINVQLSPEIFATKDFVETLPASTMLTQPYWLREPGEAGIAHVSDSTLIGSAANPPTFPVEYVFNIGGQSIIVHDQPVRFSSAQSGTPQCEQLAVVPPVWVAFTAAVRLFAPGTERTVEVRAVASRPDVAGTLSLDVPAGWSVSPASQPFALKAAGDQATIAFTVKAPTKVDSVELGVTASVGGRTYDARRLDIQYDHIPHQVLQPKARMRAVSVDLKITGRRIGYIPGAGDSVGECLEQMGFDITTLSSEDLTPAKLQGLDAVVVGVRAFNVKKDLAAGLPTLIAFAEAGSTVVVQYNRPDGISASTFAPYELKISSDRVTDETSPVTFLAPEHPVMTSPNAITAADFEGWVQERGIYFPNQWDARFVPLIACSDPGEQPMKGALLVAPCGKGRFVYTGLSWFRQLPAGVPGAYRLLANLVAPSK
jgi:LmbE family N-acetylglucosaminyl deacetylase